MHADTEIARLAACRKELVTREALLDRAVTRSAIEHRLRVGGIRIVFPGVYTTARASLTREQRWLAAVLACGPDAALADGFAAAWWRMLSDPPGPVEVVRSGPRRDGPAGVKLRHTQQLELTTERGMPVTTPARTLLDLAVTGSPGRLALAVNEAQVLHLITREELEALAHSGRRGSRAVRALLREPPGYTGQAAERRLKQLIVRAQLPPAHHNARIDGDEVDAYWAAHALIVEVDGFAAHRHQAAFERDRRRDQRRLAAGHRTLRVTWRQLTQEPEAFVASLAAALARTPALTLAAADR